jgi:6-pyruvoyltetrahydropterin/6-carboxytetrahydropterin synthase
MRGDGTEAGEGDHTVFRVSKEFRFEAAHHLPHHRGKCRRPHGHGYLVRVIFAGSATVETGPSTGMLIDYADVAALVEPVIAKLDHRDLNAILPGPTAEQLARYIFHAVSDRLDRAFREADRRRGSPYRAQKNAAARRRDRHAPVPWLDAEPDLHLEAVELHETAGTMVRFDVTNAP